MNQTIRQLREKAGGKTQATVGEANSEHEGGGCKEVEDPAVHCTDQRHEESWEDRAAIRMWARNPKSRHEHLVPNRLSKRANCCVYSSGRVKPPSH